MKAFVSVIAVAAAVSSAVAQSFTLNTPLSPQQCVPVQITWSTTNQAGPFVLTFRANDANGAPLQTYTNLAASPFTWAANASANTQLGMTLTNTPTGETAQSGTFTMADSGVNSCLDGSAAPPPPASGSGSSSATGPSAPASSPSAPVVGSSAPAGSASTPAASTPAGTQTHASTPASSSTHSGAASGPSGSASPTGAAAPGGALANTVSVGVVGALCALAAVVMA